jgi:hypothetical protein
MGFPEERGEPQYYVTGLANRSRAASCQSRKVSVIRW